MRVHARATHLLAGPEGVPHLADQGLVVPAGGRGAEDGEAGLGCVGVNVVEAARHLDLQEGVEGVLAAVQDFRLDFQPLPAPHQIGIQPKKIVIRYIIDFTYFMNIQEFFFQRKNTAIIS